MVKISIIVAVYNKEKYLKKCLESLVNQTLSNIEIIVVDDKSTDNSRDIMKYYEKQYKNKVKAIYNKKNMGIGYTRNSGIKIASGEFLGFVDADDYVSLDMYEKYYEFANRNKLDLVTGYYTKFGSENILFKNEYFEISNIKNNPELLLKLDYGPCNKIFKTNIIKDNNILFEENLKYEDMPFVAKALKHSKNIGHINESYYYYYIHSNSETTIRDKRCFDMFKIMDIVNDYYKDFSDKSIILALNILQITRYMLQQKYQENYDVGNLFIEEGYRYLEKIDPKWRKNSWYCKENLLKRFIKNNKFILKLYCKMYKTFK